MFLSIHRLGKRFGSTLALDDVSLEVEEGTFVCFLGPSGCGKTTLLRCIAGLEIQDMGEIAQNGRSISGEPPAGRDFGIVFQSYALFPNLTVEANIGYGLIGRDWPRARRDERVADMVALVGLEGQERKYPAQLSGGQQQRVALARALAPKPSLLLLDEPLSALDAKVRERLRREVKELQRRVGVTTVMVTHDQEEALVMADRVVVMNSGRIEQIGPPAEIYERPANPFVADFIGTMNFVPAEHDGLGGLHLGPKWHLPMNGALPEGLDPKAPLLCCVRPQHLRLARPSGGDGYGCRVTLKALEYLGAQYRAVVAPVDSDEIELRVDLAPEDLTSLASAPGDVLEVHIQREAVRLFPSASPA